MITKLQALDPERVAVNEQSRGLVHKDFHRRGDTIYFMGVLEP